jgi:uncharacterized integral membrane protein
MVVVARAVTTLLQQHLVLPIQVVAVAAAVVGVLLVVQVVAVSLSFVTQTPMTQQ